MSFQVPKRKTQALISPLPDDNNLHHLKGLKNSSLLTLFLRFPNVKPYYRTHKGLYSALEG